MPDLVGFATAHPEVAVVGLAVNDDPGDSRRFAERFEVPYDLGIDRKGEVAVRYGATGLPITALLDRTGRIVFTKRGAIARDELEAFAGRFGA
jgi:peroxiredoxin